MLIEPTTDPFLYMSLEPKSITLDEYMKEIAMDVVKRTLPEVVVFVPLRVIESTNGVRQRIRRLIRR